MWVIIILMIIETTANFTINNSHANTHMHTHTHTHTECIPMYTQLSLHLDSTDHYRCIVISFLQLEHDGNVGNDCLLWD